MAMMRMSATSRAIVHCTGQHIRIVDGDVVAGLQLTCDIDHDMVLVFVVNFHNDFFEFAVRRRVTMKVIVDRDLLKNHVVDAVFSNGFGRYDKPV